MDKGRILFLGADRSPLLFWLESQGEYVLQESKAITVDFVRDKAVKFIVSYGYRHIISKPILDLFPGRAVNLHISYLPWNRGADPNFWSFVDGTPKGVTIHFLDEGVDTGDIIVQKEVKFDTSKETLATSYKTLHEEVQVLFKQHWVSIRDGKCPRRVQVGKGSMHRKKDKGAYADSMPRGWDTPVSFLMNRD